MVSAGTATGLLLITLYIVCAVGEKPAPTCRYMHSLELPPEEFKLVACCNCFNYLYRVPDGTEMVQAQCNQSSYRIVEYINEVSGRCLSIISSTAYYCALLGVVYTLCYSLLIESLTKKSFSVEPVLSNSEEICDIVGSKVKCKHWEECCQEAIDCCEEMVEEQKEETLSKSIKSDADESSADLCPTTFDMFKCWKRTKPLPTHRKPCPEFLIESVKACVDPDVHYVERQCLANGTWNSSLSEALFESSYKLCVDKDLLSCHQGWVKARYNIQITCEILSLLAIIPATVIFFCLKLHTQLRIKIHINLFVALALYDSIYLIYQLTIKAPNVVDDILKTNSVGCRFLNAMTRFATLSMFMWMLMEGFNLNWLMMNTFKNPKFSALCVAGWGVPLLITSIYVIVKITTVQGNVGCWFKGDNLDWIVNGPIILCVLLNIAFLVNIMKVILTKMTARKDEPDYYARLLRAMAILVPPFGLLLLFTLYSPDEETHYKTKLVVDCVAAAILHLQGLLVAVVLCYANTEVLTLLGKVFRKRFSCLQYSHRQVPEGSVMTGVSHLSTARASISMGADHTAPTAETHLLAKQRLDNVEENTNLDSTERGDGTSH